MESEKKRAKSNPRKAAPKARHVQDRVRRKAASGHFVARKAALRRENLLFQVTDAPSGDHVLMLRNIRKGLAFEAIETLAQAFEAPRQQMADVLSITASTLNRRKKVGRLQADESDRVARLARLKDFAVEMMNGDNGAAIQWLKTPLAILGGESPLDHAATEVGAREVEDLIGRIQHGVFS